MGRCCDSRILFVKLLSWTKKRWLAKPGTVGKPRTTDHVLIVGEDGDELPAGEIGTVYLKLLKGAEFEYHGDKGKT